MTENLSVVVTMPMEHCICSPSGVQSSPVDFELRVNSKPVFWQWGPLLTEANRTSSPQDIRNTVSACCLQKVRGSCSHSAVKFSPYTYPVNKPKCYPCHSMYFIEGLLLLAVSYPWRPLFFTEPQLNVIGLLNLGSNWNLIKREHNCLGAERQFMSKP